MKLLICLIITIALAASTPAQTPIFEANKIQAKQELNEAARAYRDGNFAEAQAHSEKALQLDPENKAAPMFIARTIHAQYKPGDFTPDNVAKAQGAIIAYKRILERNPVDEEAYKAIAYLYGAIKEDELLRDWVLQRAANVIFPTDKRAEAFVVLASKDWDCSFKITEQPSVKTLTIDGDKARVTYHMPKERVEFQRARECANRGLQMVNMAITLTPENESAWAYKANILLELEKLAEMSGNVRSKREYRRQYDEALKESTRLASRPKSEP